MRRRRTYARRATRGMTLLESMFAVMILSVGIVAVFNAVAGVHTANRSLATQASSLDAFALVAAQIRDARCDVPQTSPGQFTPGMSDPGLDRIGQGWVTAAVPGSAITYVGDFRTRVPAINVSYMVSAETIPGGVPAPLAPGLEVSVRVRELQNDVAKDDPNLVDGYWIRVFPVKKLCNLRYDVTSRGEY